METFSMLLALYRSPVNSPHKGQWRGALMFSLISVWINGWINNREAGDLRRYRVHSDVTVMKPRIKLLKPSDAYMHRVRHICISKLTIIGLDNGLSPRWWQVIIWISVGILLIGALGTNFSEILIEVQTFSPKKIPLKTSSVKCCPFHLGLNVLSHLYFMFILYPIYYAMSWKTTTTLEGVTRAWHIKINFPIRLWKICYFFKTDYIPFGVKLSQNPLAWMAVLLAPGNWKCHLQNVISMIR